MSDLPNVKIEPNLPTDNDVEDLLPTFKVVPRNKILHEQVEVIDLTEDHFMNEFKSFLTTIGERRQDIDAKRNETKTKLKSVIKTLSVSIDFLSQVHVYQDSFLCELFRVNFRNAMVYGRLTAETFRENVTIYQIDDGTAKIDVFFRPSSNKKMLDNLNKLLLCEDALQRKRPPLNEDSIPDSVELRKQLKLLVSIAKARCQTQLTRFKLRTQCFAIGRPFLGREGNIAMYAESILPDDEFGDTCELFWKCYLLAMYEPLTNEGALNECPQKIADKLRSMCL
ncbi:uncharacterized protein LOC126561144 [Anopheles maculipalpis]|uniref:uncharacterized protein LOC126561144 n=1 Tax=Anopheles maculipalpis TaxID=1496333 RepID=UPI0021599FE7|nr:uncharacterized protein LOC126561144 [Anopheles maculipalpis]